MPALEYRLQEGLFASWSQNGSLHQGPDHWNEPWPKFLQSKKGVLLLLHPEFPETQRPSAGLTLRLAENSRLSRWNQVKTCNTIMRYQSPSLSLRQQVLLLVKLLQPIYIKDNMSGASFASLFRFLVSYTSSTLNTSNLGPGCPLSCLWFLVAKTVQNIHWKELLTLLFWFSNSYTFLSITVTWFNL